MADIPIEIHSESLGEWLLSRRKVEASWPTALGELRERVAAARAELPLAVRSELGSSTVIDYWRVLELIRTLEERQQADPSSGRLRNIFGSYTSDLLTTWDGVRKTYEKHGLHLAEASRTISRNVMYEIPVMRNHVRTSEKQCADLVRKTADAQRNSQGFLDSFRERCDELGVDVRASVSELPAAKEQIAASARVVPAKLRAVARLACAEKMGQALEFYAQFKAYVHKDEATALPTLRRVREHVATLPEDDVDDASEDWNVVTAEEAGDDAGEEIDWGISLEAAGEEADTHEIDWEVSLEDAGEAASETDWDMSIEAPAEDVNELTNDDTRRDFMTDLLELETFLDLRQHELEENDSTSFVDFFRDAPAVVRAESDELLAGFLDATRAVIQALRDPRLQQLISIRSSPKYVERLVATLRQKLLSSSKLADNAVSLQQRRAELQADVEKTKAALAAAVEETKRLRRCVEQTISEQYDNRTVRLFGPIDNL